MCCQILADPHRHCAVREDGGSEYFRCKKGIGRNVLDGLLLVFYDNGWEQGLYKLNTFNSIILGLRYVCKGGWIERRWGWPLDVHVVPAV